MRTPEQVVDELQDVTRYADRLRFIRERDAEVEQAARARLDDCRKALEEITNPGGGLSAGDMRSIARAALSLGEPSGDPSGDNAAGS